MAEVSFGEWLKRRRKAAGLTQEQLAEQVSCSTIMLRKIEGEERHPSAQIVERLAEIFNIPSDEQTAFLRFARGDWRSAPAIESEDAPWRASGVASRSRLPATLTPLIGREREVAQVRDYLAKGSTRLVTLTGPPGIGKTSLSQGVASASRGDFSDGVFFVALAPLQDPNLISTTIGQTLRFEERGQSSAMELLKEGIADKQLLLVLDNFEHLLDAAPIVPELLRACPKLKILVTSREALRVPGEWQYPVPPLDVPASSQSLAMDLTSVHTFAALTLFEERARAVHSDFRIHSGNAGAVAAICARLDGLPLAIELMATRIRLMSAQELLSRMDDRFTLYADGMRGVPARQKTLHNAITWSYDLLTPEEQTLFAALGVFAGGFTLEAATDVTGNRNVLQGITALLDKSLLQRVFDEQGETRFTLLFTIREFALKRLNEMNETAKVRDQHLKYFLGLAEEADQEIHGPNSVEWLDRLESDHDNYRAALDWCIARGYTESAFHLIGIFSGLGRLWSVRNYVTESRQWFEKARALPDVSQYPFAYATALNGMSFIAALQDDYSAAISMAEESQGICQSLRSEGEMALGGALFAIGLAEFWRQGNLERGKSCYEQAAVIYQAHGNDWERAFASFRLGALAGNVGNYEKAQRLFENSLVTFEALQDTFMLARAYAELGFMYKLRGDYKRARLVLEQTLDHDRRLRFPHALCTTLTSLGSTCRMQNDYDQAEVYLDEALNISREFSLFGQFPLFYLGCIMLHQEKYSQAGKHFYDSLKKSLKMDAKVNLGESLFGLAAVAAGLKEYQRAALLTGAGQVVHNTVSYKMPPHDLVEIGPLLQIAREQLGEERFEVHAAEGRAITMEQAIAYALANQE